MQGIIYSVVWIGCFVLVLYALGRLPTTAAVVASAVIILIHYLRGKVGTLPDQGGAKTD
jgi:uncharacterized membrane protein